MAETYRYFDELLGQFPDNTQGLIKAEDVRDLLVSTALRTGILQDEDLIAGITVLDGALTLINPIMVSPTFAGQGWITDGNNFLVVTNGATTVPASYTTLGKVSAFVTIQKVGGGTANYSLHITRNGVSVGQPTAIEGLTNTFVNVGFETFIFVNRDSPTDTYGIAVQGEGTTNSVDILPLEMSIMDTILASDPTP